MQVYGKISTRVLNYTQIYFFFTVQ